MSLATTQPITIPRFPATSSNASPRSSVALPRFAGLRIASVSATAFSPNGPFFAGRRHVKRASVVVCEAKESAVQLPEVSKSTWQSIVLDSKCPVLVDFWAPWCGPCLQIEPVIVKLAKSYEGKLKCYKLHTDENPELVSQYGIRSIPTMVIFENGEKKDAVIGAVPEKTLLAAIEKFFQR